MLQKILSFPLTAKLAGELNKSFQQLLKEKEEGAYDPLARGRISSYHNPLMNEPEWFRYGSLGRDYEVIITAPEEAGAPIISKMDMKLFAAENNGIAISRDNLFMLWELFRSELIKLLHQHKKEFCLVGYAPVSFLPTHHNGPHIYPVLKVDYETDKHELLAIKSAGYDWCFNRDNEQFIDGTHVAYLCKKQTKFYT